MKTVEYQCQKILAKHAHRKDTLYLDIGQLYITGTAQNAAEAIEKLGDDINARLQQRVFTKTDAGKLYSNKNILMANDITPKEIFKLGKQVIVYAKYSVLKYGGTTALNNNIIFSQVNNNPLILLPEDSNAADIISNIHPPVNCITLQKLIYPYDNTHDSLWGINGDQTKISGRGNHILTSALIHLVDHCNINYYAMDKLTNNDPRIEAAIWSWQVGFPKPINDNPISAFAQIKPDNNAIQLNKIINENYAPKFVLCRNKNTLNPTWGVLPIDLSGYKTTNDIATKAKAVCDNHALSFSMPINSQQMYHVLSKIQSPTLINYHYDRSVKRWIDNN